MTEIVDFANKAPMVDSWGQAQENQSLFNLSLDLLCVASFEGYFLRVNPAFTRTLGYREEELVNHLFFDFIHPDDISTTQQELAKLNEGELTLNFENRYKKPNGELVWLGWTAYPDEQHNVIYAVARDISSTKLTQQQLEASIIEKNQQLIKTNESLQHEISYRKRTEMALRESEKLYYTLANISPVGIFRLDSTGTLNYLNEKARALLGLANNDLHIDCWYQNIDIQQWREIEDNWRKANNVLYKTECCIHFADSDNKWVLLQIIPEYSDDNQLNGYVGTVTDITTRHQAEQLLQQHQAELAYYSRINTVGELVSSLAHELNQPLTSIVHYTGGCLEKLKASKVDDSILNVLTKVSGQAELAGNIIHRVKNFLTKGETNKKEVAIEQIIKDVIELIHFEITRQSIQLTIHLDEALPLIKVDKIQLEQVLLNLISNSIEALIEVKDRERVLDINAQLKQQQLILTIRDNGQGVQQNNRAKIFEPFFSTKVNGMGIGLAISQRIVEAHEGSLEFQAIETQGSQFTLALPIIQFGE